MYVTSVETGNSSLKVADEFSIHANVCKVDLGRLYNQIIIHP